MNRGYAKIFRCIEDNFLWRTKEPYCKRAAWMDLILLVNYKDNDFCMGNRKIVVKRGQHWCGQEELQKRWRWSEKKVRDFLRLLENEGMIYLETSNMGSMITLVNYGKYQDFVPGRAEQIKEQMTEQPTERIKEQKKNKKRTTDGATDGTDDGATYGQTRMNKNEIKNDPKNENKNVKKPAAHFNSCGVVYEE